MLKGSFL